MREIFSAIPGRVPQPYENIQINFCKDPLCPNFGVPASPEVQSRGRHANPARQDGYIRRRNKGIPKLQCKLCGAVFPIKSNLGIYEEAIRWGQYVDPDPEPSCRNKHCANHKKTVRGDPDCYRLVGKTKTGSQRYLCKVCRKTFSTSKRTINRQRKSHLNHFIFRSLVNKTSIRGMSNIFGIATGTVYDKINFIYEQCSKFAEMREARLLKGMKLPKMYISVDRQYYTTNWLMYEDRRNVKFYGLGAADNKTGYVFTMAVNYDPSMSYTELSSEVSAYGDSKRDPPFRRFARLWLQRDFDELHRIAKEKADEKKRNKKRRKQHDVYLSDIDQKYGSIRGRDDIEKPEKIDETLRLPESGVVVRTDYHMYGHFMRLRELLGGAPKLRFFLDQDSGLRAACLSAFHQEILSRKCDVFYVHIDNGKTRYERETAEKEAQKELAALCREEGIERSEGLLRMLVEELGMMVPYGPYGDLWFEQPVPTAIEPGLQVCYLTDFGDYDIHHRAWLYNKASLLGIDSYFGSIRRKLAMLERSFLTASSQGKVWHAYSPYNPGIINKILLIHRIYYNFVKTRGKSKSTPAMRLGLADAPVSVEDILYSRGIAPIRRKSIDARLKQPVGKAHFLDGPEPEPKFEAWPAKALSTTKMQEEPDQTPFVFLDIETTGIGLSDQIVEIAIVDDKGEAIVSTRVRPTCQVHPKALAIHGLSNEALENEPQFDQVEEQVIAAVKDKYVVMYSRDFDLRFLGDRVKQAMKGSFCCMREFARFHGEKRWNGDYQWKKLTEAAVIAGYNWEGNPHGALPDALACRAVWNHMNVKLSG